METWILSTLNLAYSTEPQTCPPISNPIVVPGCCIGKPVVGLKYIGKLRVGQSVSAFTQSDLDMPQVINACQGMSQSKLAHSLFAARNVINAPPNKNEIQPDLCTATHLESLWIFLFTTKGRLSLIYPNRTKYCKSKSGVRKAHPLVCPYTSSNYHLR